MPLLKALEGSEIPRERSGDHNRDALSELLNNIADMEALAFMNLELMAHYGLTFRNVADKVNWPVRQVISVLTKPRSEANLLQVDEAISILIEERS